MDSISNSLFITSKIKEKKLAPDAAYLGTTRPSDDLVLCRDKSGKATAIYGESRWDFSPYNLSVSRANKIYFNNIFDAHSKETAALTEEVRYLLYCLIYHSSAGHVGRLSVGTLLSYNVLIKKMARFCLSMKDNKLVGAISLQDLLTNKVYLAAFLSTTKKSGKYQNLSSALLLNLTVIGEEILGYTVCSRDEIKFGSTDTNQVPVIPTNIYLKIINHWTDLLDQFVEEGEAISKLVLEFKDPAFGLSRRTQRLHHTIKGEKQKKTISEAIHDGGLDHVFTGTFSCVKRNEFPSALKNMQSVVKNIIHLYTGMRDQEVMRLPYDCLRDEKANYGVKDHKGRELDQDRVITLLSTTTKFTGYRKEESWLAPQEVVKAIRFLQAITKGIAEVGGYDLSEVPLFINTGLINRPKQGILNASFTKARLSRSYPAIIIQATDLEELKATDPNRNFDIEEKFAAGQHWPLSSHQYRRSLAFYASNSGFVSLSSLKKQFKHITRQMIQYYCNGFENLKSVFGAYDEKKKDFVLSSSHIAYEFQTGITIDVAHQILADVIGADDQLFGATGSYIEKQRSENIGKINIRELRKDTEKRVAKGELAYRETLLGGCTKIGDCDEYMMADFTSCLSCPGSIIKPEKLGAMVEQSEAELARYEQGTGEYQIVKSELNKLLEYQEHKIKPKLKETSDG